jgi:hypothetical protein
MEAFKKLDRGAAGYILIFNIDMHHMDDTWSDSHVLDLPNSKELKKALCNFP